MTTVAHNQQQTSDARQPGAQAPAGPIQPGKLGVPPRPQVNLLPPEITRRRQVAGAQRRVVWMIIATLLLIVVAFGAAFLVRSDAAFRQEESLATADELMQQKRAFSPVIEVMNGVERIQDARTFVLLTEVNWATYIYALAAVLPDDVTIDSLAVTSSGANEDLVAGADDLTTAGVGVITFAASSATLPIASEWIDAMEAVPGLADVNLQSTQLTDETGEVTYNVSVTVQVTIDALAWREFADEAVDVPDVGGDPAVDAEDGE